MIKRSELERAIRQQGGMTRRLFLAYTAAMAATPWLAERTASAALTRPSFPADPFTLGVASGDPDHASVVLWTRLAPAPLEPDGGMRPDPVAVAWEVAEDEGMRKVVRAGTATATPGFGHSVHAEVDGLRPDRWYWYRFRAGDARSPVGRTRTLPDPAADPGALRFAFASCQHYEAGLFTAYEQMARDELDLVVHLGDYIYEGAGTDRQVRRHHGGREILTLTDYRVRHSQYRSDPMLQAAHARCPWFLTWDDHEVSNNYAADRSNKRGVSTADFLARRAAGYQAYYERCRSAGPACPGVRTCTCTGGRRSAGWPTCCCSTPASTGPSSRPAAGPGRSRTPPPTRPTPSSAPPSGTGSAGRSPGRRRRGTCWPSR
jgi:alkaline phosphatase D